MKIIQQKIHFNRLYFIVFMLLITVFIVQPMNVHASTSKSNEVSGLHITAKAGYNDQYKERTITPVFMTLTNESEKTIAGDFVLNIATTNGITVSHITAVEISAGDEVSFVVEVEGKLVQHYNSFHFFEGGIDKGKEISFSGQHFVSAKILTNENIIGIVANDPDTLNFLVFLNQYGYQIETSILGEDFEVPSANALKMFDIMFINDVATSGWSEEKVTAIKQWVQDGGSLVLSGGASYAKTMEAFKDITPVIADGTTLLEQTEEISQFASDELQELGPILLSNGSVKQGQTILKAADQPIVASHFYGKGNVYYIGFDPALEPFSIWKEASGFIGNMLYNELGVNGVNYNEKSDFSWALRDAVSMFPQLNEPQLALLLLIIACYIIIAAPIMYIVLKKLDKREYAWWTIPTVAVITVGVIILTGSADKNEHHVHTVMAVEINDELQSTQGIVSVFLSSNDQLTMELPSHQSVTFQGNEMMDVGRLTENYEYKHYAQQDQQTLEWNHNNYWSTRTLLLNEASELVNQSKTIETTVIEKDEVLYLTVKNTTGEKLEHIGLVNGAVIYKLGSLENEEELEYELPSKLQMTRGTSSYFDYADQLFNQPNQTNVAYQREAAFLQVGSYIDERISIIAFSYDNKTDYQLNQKKYKQNTLTFWSKPLVNVIQKFKANEHYYEAVLDKAEPGQFEMFNNNEFYLNIGEIELLFTIPSQGSNADTTFQLASAIDRSNNLTAAFYNVTSEQWDHYVDEQLLLADYMDESGKIRLKMSTQYGANSFMPTLVLESEGLK